MRKKMAKEMEGSKLIDEAFKTIKTATQVADVQEMVRKFLTREQTYSQLLKTVTESEAKIEVLKVSNEDLRNQLHTLTLDSSNGQQVKSSGNQGSTAAVSVSDDSDIIMMKQELGTIMQHYNRLGDRFKGINIVND